MEKSIGKVNKIYVMQLATIFIGFIIFGFSENIKGPAIPRIQFEFMLSESQLGTLLSLNALGYLIACSFTAYLTKIWGIKWVTITAFASMAVSGILIYFSNYYMMFSASYFLMYIGNGMLEIGLAILSARIFVKNTGMMMNMTHGFYGLSSTIAPLIATGLMKVTIAGHTLDWRGMYLVMLLLSVIPIVIASCSTFPGEHISHEDRIPIKVLLKDRVLWLIVLVLTFGVVSELAVGGWLVNFLEKAYNWNSVNASGMLSIFFLCFALARLLLGPLTDRIGFVLSLIIFSGFSALCTFTAIVGGESVSFLFAASGIGIALIYPTVMAFIAKRYPNDSDTAITFTVTVMGLGSVIGNYLIGGVTELVKHMVGEDSPTSLLRGLQAGYGFIGLCAALCAITGFILYVYLYKRKEVI
ncbi:MFS transporter [Paenibacillus qinlingensis]|uniref:Fucose permease n=1 Tax=Paenibacillus qinlingensis TaxID=1837343 RepID=A0ABU1NWJ9_9BACL|nr:MFS transporter [Paenibacillus qinlingensis]MDR6551810.1 fucose permease [Paenibacillus qinlingensis]